MEIVQTEYYSVVQKIVIVGKAYVEKNLSKMTNLSLYYFDFIYVNENQKLQMLLELLD